MARSAAARMADHLSGEDQTVPQSVIDNLPKGATEDFLVAPPSAKDVTPRKKVQPIRPEVPSAKAPKQDAKPKTAKPKAPIARVPAADVVALIKELGITNTQFGQALGVGPSMVSEFVGKGRGNLMARTRWPEAQTKARAFAKKSLK